MNKIKLYQVDTFTNKLFSGNPAAVCMLDEWLSDEIMQNIAKENNLAETAFVVKSNEIFQIRWFTPTVEVDLCGHATLAAAYVIFNCLNYPLPEICFLSHESGELFVTQQEGILFLNFPIDNLTSVSDSSDIMASIGIEPIDLYHGKTDMIAVLNSETEIKMLNPDLSAISKLPVRGLIVTAKGDKVDFVSRFFAPQLGVDEDPVTGSAHTSLIPIWSKRLYKESMLAKQLSQRGGDILCLNKGDRCLIGGSAKLYMTGEITLD